MTSQCTECGSNLKTYWLKDGVCNGCRNPELVVQALTKLGPMNPAEKQAFLAHSKISVEIRNVYGAEKIYPACERSATFAKMLKQATLTERDVNHIKALGFIVEVISSAPKTL